MKKSIIVCASITLLLFSCGSEEEGGADSDALCDCVSTANEAENRYGPQEKEDCKEYSQKCIDIIEGVSEDEIEDNCNNMDIPTKEFMLEFYNNGLEKVYYE
jgi:hypothetical protein